MKEQLVKILQGEGYDMISACEIAAGFIADTKLLEPGVHKFYTDTTSIKIRVK